MAALHERCFPDHPWSAADFTTLLERPGTQTLFNTSQTCLLMLSVIAPEAEILTLATDPAARRQGAARALINRFASDAPAHGITTLFLEVASDNHAARQLYAGLGFVETGRRRAYYHRKGAPAADALVLRCDLTHR